MVSGLPNHDADFFADLIGEDGAGFRFADEGGQFAHRLAHEPRLRAHGDVAHLAFEFRLGDKRSDRIEDDDIDGIRLDQRFGDGECFLAGIGLGNEKLVHVDAELAGVDGIERVFDVDEGSNTAHFLCLGNDGQGERRFTGGFRAENFDDAAAGKAADAERRVDRDVAGRDGLDGQLRVSVAEAHDRTFAVFLGYGLQGEFEIFVPSSVRLVFRFRFSFCLSFSSHSGM